MKKAVIFDLDGTLLDTLEDLSDSCNETLRRMNFPLRSIDEVRQFVGNGISRLMELAVPAGTSNLECEKSISLMKSIYAENCKNKTRPYKGIEEMLSELQSMKIKIGIASNKPDAQVKNLAACYFSSAVRPDAAVGDCAERKRKPAPDSLLEVMRVLNVDRSEVLYVGDSDVDIKTAENASVPCVSVSWGFRTSDFLNNAGAKKIIDSPMELLDCL
ncbi:HAD family hydrolase [Treponema sp.]|uniref:HAD family hydrolase n=1 Tax=Treponema sp. TaxID=166 RepID=UPI003F0F9091